MTYSNHLNLYKAFLIKELMRSQCIHAKDAMNYVNDFVGTPEGASGFTKWRNAQLSLHQEKKPTPIRKFIEKIECDLDPISQQKDN